MRHLATKSLLTGLAILSGCSSTVSGIFYTLATEDETVRNLLAKDVSVTHVVRENDTYLAAAGALWARDAKADPSGGNLVWAQVSHDFASAPSGTKIVTALTGFSGDIVASFLFADSTFGLFSGSPPDPTGTPPAITWSDVSAISDQVVALMVPEAGTMFVSTAAANSDNLLTYGLHYTTDGTTFTQLLQDEATPVTQVAFDGTFYWFSAATALYTASSPLGGLGSLTVVTGPEDSGVFSGVGYANGVTLAATRDGRLHRSVDEGTSWASYPEGDALAIGSSPLRFTEVSYAEDADQFVVGTEVSGYYTVEATSALSDTTVLRFSNRTVAGLYDAVVLRFYLDTAETEQRLFACTAGGGAWSAPITDGEIATWVWE